MRAEFRANAAWRAVSKAERRRGTASIEYAVVIAMVVGVLLMAGEVLRLSVKHATHRVGASMAGDLTSLDEDGQSAARSTAIGAVAEDVSPADTHVNWPRLLIIGVVLLVGCPSWYWLRERRLSADRCPIELVTPSETEESLEKLPQRVFDKRQAILRMFADQSAALAEGSLPVRCLMSPHVTSVTTRTRVGELRRIMAEHQIRHVLVCELNGPLAGVVSDRDLHRKSGKTAGEIMTRRPLSVTPDSPLNLAVSLMVTRHVSCLPVMEGGVIAGILTSTDLMIALQCLLSLCERRTVCENSGCGP